MKSVICITKKIYYKTRYDFSELTSNFDAVIAKAVIANVSHSIINITFFRCHFNLVGSLPVNSCCFGFQYLLHFRKRSRCCVSRGGHGQGAVGGAVINRIFRAPAFHQAVNKT